MSVNRKTAVFVLVGALAGAAAGAGSAWWLSGHEGWLGEVRVGEWQGSRVIGSPDADPWTRAITSRIGLLALERSEATYYIVERDADGRRFEERCRYRVEFGKLPARWWTLTIYDEERFLARNEDEAHSVGQWHDDLPGAIHIGLEEPPENLPWLSSNNAGRFSMLLRLYHPREELLEAPTRIDLPSVRRLGCPDEGGSS